MANSAFIEVWQHLRKDTPMDGRCISQNELAQRWQISEATLERWRSQQKQFEKSTAYHLNVRAVEGS